MSDEKVYTPEVIEENPLPDSSVAVPLQTSQPGNKSAGTMEQVQIKERGYPGKKVAHELMSAALNTRTRRILEKFEFTPSGSLQIGDYQEGDSGDIQISPNGIVARDVFGNTTFALDGTDGSAVFAGTIQTGALISGVVAVGDNSVVIDGESRSIIINDGTNDIILIGFQEGGF